MSSIEARTTDAAVRARTARLRKEVDALTSAAGPSGDPTPLLRRLDAFGTVVRSLGVIPDAGIQARLGDLETERRYGLQRLANGLAPDDFDGRRRELLTLLDTIESREPQRWGLQAEALRQRVLAMRPGSVGDDDLKRDRQQAQRQLDRLRLYEELEQHPRDRESTPAAENAVSRRQVDEVLQRVRAAIATRSAVPAMDRAADAEMLAGRREAFKGLLTGPCTKCHVISEGGGRLLPVRVAEPVMPRGIFNHAPHLTKATCEACHGGRPSQGSTPDATAQARPSVWRSEYAEDVNVPGQAVCATCHSASKARATCETCHVYHASSPAKLIRLTP